MTQTSADPEPDYDAIIIGAGISGMYQLLLLRRLGLKVRVFEAGTGVGGVWYWNRYPGARFDSESWSYGYSFCPEILEEWDWTEHFSPQPETERYLNMVADKYDLRRDISFSSRVSGATFDDAARAWEVTLEDGTRHSARFLITCIGPLSAPTMPRFEGVGDFEGEAYHTGLWPKHPVDFTGKRVAVIGTGASGVQTISEVAKTAGHLTVFQRRPNWCTPLHNGPIDSAEMEEIRARYPEIFANCQETNACFIHTPDPRGTFEVSEAEREAVWERLYASPGFGIWQGNFRDILTDPEANRLLSEFVARKIRERVQDPETAEKLIPTDHGFGTRRVPQETGYYEAYNQPNTRLVSMLETPIERITATGLETTEETFEFDMIIYATGFDAVTGSFDRMDIRGTSGLALRDRWADGPETFCGMMIPGFPNLFMIIGPHQAMGNIPRSIEFAAEWVRDHLAWLGTEGLTWSEAREDRTAEWMAYAWELTEGLMYNDVDSWMTGVNMNVDGRQVRRLVRFNGTAPDYRARCDAVAADGYKDLILS